MLKAHKQPPEILTVLIYTVVFGLNVFLFQKTDHLLLQLSAALARNDLYERNAFLYGLLNNIIQRLIDLPALVIDVVQV